MPSAPLIPEQRQARVLAALRRDGTQKNVIDTMQTRMELYDTIGYHAFEQKLDQLFAEKGAE